MSVSASWCRKADDPQSAPFLSFDRPIHRLPDRRCSRIQPALDCVAVDCAACNGCYAPQFRSFEQFAATPRTGRSPIRRRRSVRFWCGSLKMQTQTTKLSLWDPAFETNGFSSPPKPCRILFPSAFWTTTACPMPVSDGVELYPAMPKSIVQVFA